jgi:hypothetical protein
VSGINSSSHENKTGVAAEPAAPPPAPALLAWAPVTFGANDHPTL